MAKLIILKFERGNFQEGFEVTLQIGEDSGDSPSLSTEISGKFPPYLDIPSIYQRWHLKYEELDSLLRLESEKPHVSNTEEVLEQCHQFATEFRNSIKSWLTSENRDFQKIREKILEKIPNNQETIRVLIQTEEPLLRKLPWQEWDLFADIYTKAEIALSAIKFDKSTRKSKSDAKVRILAILGNSEGIDVESDRQSLEDLRTKGADPKFLPQPKREQISDKLWEQDWDILFFSGHSSSQGETGRIFINRTDSMTISELKPSLRRAIEHGLQLAIFNSCDGLKLADDLAELNIPQVIVMREQVPDRVAQAFLKLFLKAFSEGQSLYLAVRQARERMGEKWDKEYPGASWLPVICQNPTAALLSWNKLKWLREHKILTWINDIINELKILVSRKKASYCKFFCDSWSSVVHKFKNLKILYDRFIETFTARKVAIVFISSLIVGFFLLSSVCLTEKKQVTHTQKSLYITFPSDNSYIFLDDSFEITGTSNNQNIRLYVQGDQNTGGDTYCEGQPHFINETQWSYPCRITKKGKFNIIVFNTENKAIKYIAKIHVESGIVYLVSKLCKW